MSKQLFDDLPTYCYTCKQRVTMKPFGQDGSYTRLCKCGCSIYRYHIPDEFNKTAYFIYRFVPKSIYDKDYKNKSELEKQGFKKQNGRYVK